MVEILREAGNRGMHVDDIAKRISSAPSQFCEGDKGVDPGKLGELGDLWTSHTLTPRRSRSAVIGYTPHHARGSP